MKRRNFLKGSMVAGLTPLFVNGYSMNRLGATLAPASTCSFDDRILVVVYLAGANDVINMAVPLNHYTDYQTERPLIHIPQTALTTLDATQPNNKLLGLHPSLVGNNSIKSMYDEGKVSLIQRVSYPSPNRSHFAAEDTMLKGIDGTVISSTVKEGWIGSYLDDKYPGYNGLPFGNEQDPLGIVVGGVPNTGFHTPAQHSMEINLTGQDPSGFYNLISSLSGEPIFQFEHSDHGNILDYMSKVEKSTQVYSQRISNVFNQGTNDPSAGYPNSGFGDQLKTIARFISGGSRTKVYMAGKGGWDTHIAMAVPNASTTGTHANLLKDLSDALGAFQKDLASTGNSGKVLTVVFSEFGRKITENGSVGTDHGTVSSMFIVGDHSTGGIFGDNIDITQKDYYDAPDPSQTQYDYRRVLGSVLQDWMGASNDSINKVFPGISPNFNPVQLGMEVDPSCYFAPPQPVNMFVRAKVLLGGFYDPTTGMMRTDLKDNGFLTYQQPYANTRFSYYGEEQVTAFPADTVDWVLMELINSSDFVIRRQALLLRNDGRLMTLSGSLQIPLDEIYPEPFRIALLHRNHIGVITKNTIDAIDGANPYINLTTGTGTVEGFNQLKDYNGTFALYPADADQNGLINSLDYNEWKRKTVANPSGYQSADFNGDGVLNQTDYSKWLESDGKVGNPGLYSILER